MPKPVKIKFGPFVGGINRLKARTQLSTMELWDARGMIQEERGRLRSCWESASADTYGGVTNTFSKIDSYYSAWTASTAYTIGQMVVPITRAGFVFTVATAGTSGSTGNEPDWPTSIGNTITDNGAVWLCIGVDADAAPISVEAWKEQSLMVAGSDYLGQLAGKSVPLYLAGETAQKPYFHQIGEWLLVCADGVPAKVYNNAALTTPGVGIEVAWSPENTAIVEPGRIRADARVAHYPIWLYRTWHTTGTMQASITATLAQDSGTWFNPNGPHGNAATVTADYETNFMYFKTKDTLDPENAMPGGLAVNVDANGTANAVAYFDNPGNADTNYRAGVLAQEAMYRFPATYQGRLCAVEGRTHNYSLLHDTANTTVSGVVTVTGKDVTDIIGRDDEIIVVGGALDENPPIKDPVIFYENDEVKMQKRTVTLVVFSTNTTITYTGDDITIGSTDDHWYAKRALSRDQRNTVYFTGRPADAANGITANTRDFFWLNTSNAVIVGEGGEGDITGMWSQGDDRLLVGLNAALYEIVGTLPLDGVAPPGFDVRQITSSAGVLEQEAGTFDDSGNIFYFCSGTDFGLYVLYGQTVERIDSSIRSHPQHPVNASTPVGFKYLSFANKRLYCWTSESDPFCWVLDTEMRTESAPYGSWTYTKRVNAGQDQTGTLAAVEISAGQTENKLYNGSGKHGGGFAPYRKVQNEPDRELVAYYDGSDYSLRSLNHLPDEHNDANLLHSCKVETGFVDGSTMAPKRTRQMRALDAKPMNINSGTTTALNEVQFTLTNSEGFTSLTRTVTPERSDGDSNKYRVQGVGGRGDTSISVALNNSATVYSPIGELDSIEVDVIPMEHRNR